VRVTRIYTGADARSHFEELDIPTTDTGRGAETTVLATGGAILRDRRGVEPMDMDFHCAPRRQLVINVGGAVEVETGDGTVRRFEAGDVLFADDTTGEGHKTRSVGQLSLMVFLPLPEDFDPSVWAVAT
jgi:hypothetical protein